MKKMLSWQWGATIVAAALVVIGGYVLRAGAQQTPEAQLLDQVVTALGGRDRLMSVRTLVIEGSGKRGDLNALMAAESPFVGWDVRFRRTLDLTNGRMRYWQANRSLFPARFDLQPAGGARTVAALDGDIAFTMPADGSMIAAWADSNPDGLTSIGSTWGIGTPERPSSMDLWVTSYPSAVPPPQRVFGQAAVSRRREMLHHPLTIVRAALAGATLSGLRADRNFQLVDMKTPQGDTMTLAIDQTTKLPSWVSHMEGNAFWGDVTIRTAFGGYEESSGLKLPRRLIGTLDKFIQTDMTVAWNIVDAEVGDLAAPTAIAAAAPVQQSLVLEVEEVPGTTGIWKISPRQGQIRPDQRPDNSATCLIEFADHMVLFDLPGGDAFVTAVIQKARELRPNKPITKLILSHFDPGHTAGVRGAVASGMSIITYKNNVNIYTDVVERRHTINPDMQSKNPRPLDITPVDDSYVLKDATREVQIYHRKGDGESATMIVAYLPRERVLVNTDAWNVITAQTPNDSDSPSLYDNIQRRKLQVERHVPLHSIGMPTQAEFMKQLAYTRTLEYQFYRLAQRLRIDNEF